MSVYGYFVTKQTKSWLKAIRKTLAHVSFHFDLANLQAVAQLCQGLVLLEQEVSWFQVRWLIFFLVPGTVLWFRFNMRIMLVTH